MQKLTAVGLTDVGRKRDHNEDSLALERDHALYVVCDGMGGHASGEVASRIAVECVVDFVRANAEVPLEALPYKTEPGLTREGTILSNAVQHANERVFVEGMKDPKLEGMGTTLVAIWATAREVVVGHVGDSRIYRANSGGILERLTRDHSLLNYKIDKGELTTAEEIAGFRQGNVIVRALGMKDWVEPEVTTVLRRPGDVYLLCSDGLTDLVDDNEIRNVLATSRDDLSEAASRFVRMANDAGGKDNITVLLVRVDDSGPPVAEAEPDHFHEDITRPRGVGAFAETIDRPREPTLPTRPPFDEADGDDDDELEDDSTVGFHEADTDPNMPVFDPDEYEGEDF